MKMRKPEPRIYHYTLEQLNVESQDAVFLDDIDDNIKCARDLGIRAIKVPYVFLNFKWAQNRVLNCF